MKHGEWGAQLQGTAREGGNEVGVQPHWSHSQATGRLQPPSVTPLPAAIPVLTPKPFQSIYLSHIVPNRCFKKEP